MYVHSVELMLDTLMIIMDYLASLDFFSVNAILKGNSSVVQLQQFRLLGPLWIATEYLKGCNDVFTNDRLQSKVLSFLKSLLQLLNKFTIGSIDVAAYNEKVGSLKECIELKGFQPLGRVQSEFLSNQIKSTALLDRAALAIRSLQFISFGHHLVEQQVH